MSKTGVDNLSNRIIQELKTYADTTSEKVKEAVKNVSKTVKEDIENTAPKHTGKYAKSWAVKTVKETENALTLVVHSKNKYQLTHLLEYGHAKRGGGRVEARAHIKLAEEKAVKSFEEKIREAIEHD